MSAATQTNGKKSSNSSAVNTPASTPVTNGNSQIISQSTPPPPNNNAPKYGTLVPNRIFVGGISANTTEGELLQLFSNYGTVKAAKIIQDRAGVSKGYGFITFESEDDAKRPLKDADNIVLRERKLNIAPAIKKQPFNRAFDASSPSTVAPGNTAQYFFPPSAGVPYFQGGVTYYQQPPTAPGDPNSQPTTVYQAPPVYPAQTGPPQAPTYSPMMFPHHIYMPQQYAMPPMPYDYNYYPNNGGPQYMVGGQNGAPSNCGGGSSGPGSSGQQTGGNNTPMPSSSSPPRPPPPCYNPQLPTFTPDPSLYYNLPAVYGGGPLDSAAAGVYAESLDMANGGYSEVSQILGDFFSGFDGMSEVYTTQDLISHPQYPQPTPPPPPQPTQQPSAFESAADANDPDNSRQTKTPVVSLLSMEQHQEKDLVSMQGGRRVKLQPPPPPPPQQVLPPPLVMPPPHFQHQPPPMFFNFNGPPMRSQMPLPPPQPFKHARDGNMHNGWRGKPRSNYNTNNGARKYNENGRDLSSRSSLRTDSNSSANDENRDLPPPPPPPHPASMPPPHTYHMYNGTRTYQNSLGRRNNHNNSNSLVKKEDNNNTKTNKNFAPSAPQVRTGNQQTFMMAARRNKRPTRRQQAAGGGPGEIGAGDAPLLPNNDIADACKKLETLKM